MPLPVLRIVIVNWNAGEQLCQCLESIVRANTASFLLERVIVVDNASTDGSTDGLETRFCPSLPLVILRNATNRGFAAACNQGAVGFSGTYLLLLNPDTRLDTDSLAASISCLHSPEHARTGILGVCLRDETGELTRNCARFPTVWSLFARSLGWDKLFPRQFPPNFMVEWDHRDSRVVDQVMGAYFLVRWSVWQDLGGMDERFFVYYEDLDFAFRAKKAGWNSFYWVGTSVFHRGRGTTEGIKPRRLAYNLHSRILYARKHFGPVAGALVLLATLGLEPLSRFGRALLTGKYGQISETAQGFALLWQRLLHDPSRTPKGDPAIR